ncbi:MAG: DUF6794 domain-containing protein [Saprospiraceae bacterium]
MNLIKRGLKFSLVLIVMLSIVNIGNTQANDDVVIPSGKKEFEKLYLRNIKKTRINGVYIPKDLDDAFKELDALSPENAKLKFKNAAEDVIATKLHFGLGRWIKVYWNFTEGSRYVEYLRQMGLTDHDHMIQFTIVSYHRYKNNTPLEIEKRVEAYKIQRQEHLLKMKARSKVIHTEIKKIDKKG